MGARKSTDLGPLSDLKSDAMVERLELPAIQVAIKAADEDVAAGRLSSQRDVAGRIKARLKEDGL